MKKCLDCFIGLEFFPYEGHYPVGETDIIEHTDNYINNEYFDKFIYCPLCGNKIDWKSIELYIKKYGINNSPLSNKAN